MKGEWNAIPSTPMPIFFPSPSRPTSWVAGRATPLTVLRRIGGPGCPSTCGPKPRAPDGGAPDSAPEAVAHPAHGADPPGGVGVGLDLAADATDVLGHGAGVLPLRGRVPHL